MSFSIIEKKKIVLYIILRAIESTTINFDLQYIYIYKYVRSMEQPIHYNRYIPISPYRKTWPLNNLSRDNI